MKCNTIYRLLPALALAWAGIAEGHHLSSLQEAPVVKLNMPAIPADSTADNRFAPEQLLKARAAAQFRLRHPDWTQVTADTVGGLIWNKPATPELHTVTTRLRSPRYATGKVVLHSPSRAALSIEADRSAEKTTADSVSGSISSVVTLLPGNTVTITADVLAMPDDPAAPSVRLEFIPDDKFADTDFVYGPETSGRFMPVNTMTGARITSVSVSPDGLYFIARYRQVYNATETETWAMLAESATGNIISQSITPDARWMPSGHTLYAAIKTPENYKLQSIAVPSLAIKTIATNVPTADFVFASDTRHIYYYDTPEVKQESGPLHRYLSPDDRIPGNRNRAYIVSYDLETGIASPLTYSGDATYINDISSDGKKLLYTSQRQEPSCYPFYFTTLVELDLPTMRTDTIIADNGYLNNAIYSPNAKRLFITGGPQTFGDLGVNAGNHPIPNSFDIQGFIYTIATGDVKAVTRDFDPAVEAGAIWNRADNRIYFRAEEGFNTTLYVLDPKSYKISRIATTPSGVSSFSMGIDNARRLAYIGSDFTDTGMAYMIDLNKGTERLIDDPMQVALDGITFGEMKQWQFTARDGSTIDGYICLPPDFDASRKYPLIVYYYGGTSPSTAAMHHLYSPQVFASRDYVVYVLNPSGTTGYGQEFSARHVNAWGDYTADDIIEGVEKFCDAHPFVDRKKIGCLGASYGGFMTQYLQTKTDLFACAVSHAGISNVTSYWGEGYWGYSYNSVAAAQRYPWTDPELYTKHGSLFNADKIHTPLLLLHGNLDTNVPIGESIQLFNALKVLGREVEFISVDDENHVISNFDRKLLWQNTIMAWFAKYLKNDSAWWDSLYK